MNALPADFFSLEPASFPRLRALFEPASIHLALPAILSGSVPAQVFVDDASQPRSALVHAGHRYFLLGQPDQPAFNRALRQYFIETILPHGQAAGHELFGLYYHGPDWEELLQNIFAGQYPLRVPREYYQFDMSSQPPPVEFPPSFTLRPVDADLLAMPHLARMDHLREELCSERSSVEDFLAHSFGVCLLHEDELAGWCLSEYNTGSRCEVGIETAEKFQRRGLGAAMTREFCRQAFQHGITTVGWHCFARNLPSAATARKAGFSLINAYHAYLIWYDPRQSPAYKP